MITIAFNAVPSGVTTSIDRIEAKVPPIAWIPNDAAVERNIELGLVEHPQVRVNGAVVWQWPEERR